MSFLEDANAEVKVWRDRRVFNFDDALDFERVEAMLDWLDLLRQPNEGRCQSNVDNKVR